MIRLQTICNWRVPARRALASVVLMIGLASCAVAGQPAACPAAGPDVLMLAPLALSPAAEAKPCRAAGWLGAEFHGTVPAAGRQLHYAAFLPEDIRKPDSVIVYIPGGPGARILDGFDLAPGPKALVRALARRCRSGVLIPVYTGTADVSHYPGSSLIDAIADVDAFLKHVKKIAAGRPVILVTASLGTYIYANSSKGQIDAHIAMVPLLRSPDAFMQFVINDSTRGGYQEIARNRWKTYQVGIPQTAQSIRVADFTRAFFGQHKGNAVSLTAAYRQNPANKQELQSTHYFVGASDIEAGPYEEFQESLAAAGLTTSSLNTSGHVVDESNASAILQQSEHVLPKGC